MNVYLFDRLICTDITVTFNGKSKTLKNVVVDTGAAQSIINSIFVADLEIAPSFKDKMVKTRGIGGDLEFFYRTVDELKIGDFTFKNYEIDFGEIDPKGEISGLIGLDLLNELRAVIDVEIPIIYNKT
ncbi:MAG: retropepsin-like domain-containing protein [Firmicutes bacterium]|nr:retropepsin-like domain-containing protein [Bacillota bacterium]